MCFDMLLVRLFECASNTIYSLFFAVLGVSYAFGETIIFVFYIPYKDIIFVEKNENFEGWILFSTLFVLYK